MAHDPPQDLVAYLTQMIGTPEMPGIYWDYSGEELDKKLAECEENSLPGLLLNAQPTEAQAASLLRVLMPGAHLLAIAPEDEPTGHTGASRLEDEGFEIRDAILWVRDASKLHYVPKTSRKEREAGCDKIKGKAGHEAVGRKKDSAGVNNPRAGAGRTAPHIKNIHPTVKPIALMERLLADIPKGSTILDPFMGSGSTGLACTHTGYSFIGIEKDPEYLEIADARIRYWNDQKAWAEPRDQIISDHVKAPVEKAKPVGLDILFGFGEDD